MTGRLRRVTATSAGLAVLVVASLLLAISHGTPRLALPKPLAIHAVLANKPAAAELATVHYDRIAVSPVDGELDRVTFSSGAAIVFDVAVTRSGAVSHATLYTSASVPYGNWIAYDPLVLIALALVNVIVCGVVPLRRIRNLDVLALLSFVAPVVLLQQRLVAASMLSALPGLVYLAVRCAWVALGGAPHGPDRTRPSVPIYRLLTRRSSAEDRLRWLRVALLVLALVYVMVAVSSTGVDVIYAVMEGATKLIHGVVPYGHLPGDIVHGDTYPILSYLLYTPLAAISPVSSSWDSVDLALGASAVVAVGVAAMLYGAVAPRRGARSVEDRERGSAAALAWLSFPVLLVTVSTGTTDVVLGALLVWAVILWRRPAASTAVLAAAGWFKLAPFALLPIWLAPRRRLWPGLAAAAAVSATMLAVVVVAGGLGAPSAMAHALTFQFQRGSPRSIWVALHAEWLQPGAEAAVLAIIAAACVRLRREPEIALDRRRIAALAACVLLGLQLAANYWAFLYTAWFVPLIGLSLLVPAAAPVAEESRVRESEPASPGRRTVLAW